MYNLVYEKRNDIFTTSMVIAQETDNQHESIVRRINECLDKLAKMGRVRFSDLKSGNPLGGRPTRVYELNEMQATFLITLLQNTDKVIEFKFELVQEFYRMRQALLERQTTDWLKTRQKGKLIRREETDVIQLLIPYAEEQGSKNTKMFYINYSKMVNKAVGLESGQRDAASHKTLMLVALMEDIISNTIAEEMEHGTYYKTIYQKCKAKIESFVGLVYLRVS